MKNRYILASESIVRADIYRKISIILLLLLFQNICNKSIAQEPILNQKISIQESKSTVYEIFSQITELTGYFFIYDSKLIDSDRIVKVSSEGKSLKQFLDELLNDKTLDFKIIDRHILICKKEISKTNSPIVKKDSTKILSIKGQIFDKQTKNPLPFVSVGIMEENLGTISNFDGFFTLKILPKFYNTVVIISHLGFKSQQIPIQAFIDHKVDIFLETEYISIQEVIIRNIDPIEVIKKVYANRLANYSNEPVYITGFYREGVQKDAKYLNYSEAIVKIYKSSIDRSIESDQVKLLQSRKVINIDQKDTLIIKLKAGLRSSLTLDLIKSIPDFLNPEFIDSYNYSRADIVSVNSRNAYAIDFEQKESISDPLYKGTMYIDMETYAIVNAVFEINPRFVQDTDEMFVIKKSRKIKITPKKISYSVNYNYRNGKYYLGHIRGDLQINYKKRYKLFSDDFRVFLELVSCQVDTINVNRFNRDESIKMNTVFLDAKFVFDQTYWGDYNIITPEEKISQALSRINTKMEFVKPD